MSSLQIAGRMQFGGEYQLKFQCSLHSFDLLLKFKESVIEPRKFQLLHARVHFEKNVRKVAERKTVIICHNQSYLIILKYLKFVCKSLLICLLLHQVISIVEISIS